MPAAPPSPPLAVSLGDPAGIGPDIVLSAWAGRHTRPLPRFVVYGDPSVLAARAQGLGLALDLALVTDAMEAAAARDDRLAVLAIPIAAPVTPGRPAPANAGTVIGAIDAGVAAVQAGQCAALVTCPIAKEVLYAAGFRHPGHTEYLAALAEAHAPGTRVLPVMMLVADELKVVPLTIHMALADVVGHLSAAAIVATVRIMAASLQRDFGLAQPRIAVAGLNPHAGEGGSMGREEIEIIAPAIASLRAEGLAVTGPHPADTLFHAVARQRYDAALAMYHDQALIPIKTLAFDRGVNVTLGLPFVRTSPDHGTAFDIAGSGRADPTSFIEALLLAARMAAARARWQPS